MTPGPELDRLVAEKVMGFTPPFCDCDATGGERKSHGEIHPLKPGSFVMRCERCGNLECDDYSTFIAHAWEVVEKIVAGKKHEYQIARIESRGGSGVVASFTGYSEGGEVLNVVRKEAPTAPHAICLAALKALEK